MPKPLSDELLHSWIYRVQLKNGFFKADNIVGKKGHWLSFPKLPLDRLSMFNQMDECAVLHGLTEIGALAKSNHFLYLPTSNQRYIYQFIGEDRRTASSSFTQPIRYCQECIKASLLENGFGYFKKSWYFQNYCKIHETYLNFPTGLTRVESFSEILKILSGEHPSDYSMCFKDQFVPNHRGVSALVEDYISPCLNLALKEFVMAHSPELRKKDNFRGRIVHVSNYSFLVPFQNEFQKILREYPEKWDEFLKENAISKEMQVGILSASSFKVKVHRSKTNNCQRCDSYTCAFYSGNEQ